MASKEGELLEMEVIKLIFIALIGYQSLMGQEGGGVFVVEDEGDATDLAVVIDTPHIEDTTVVELVVGIGSAVGDYALDHIGGEEHQTVLAIETGCTAEVDVRGIESHIAAEETKGEGGVDIMVTEERVEFATA